MEIEKCISQKISFKVFSNEQKSKMQTKYPFLSKSQINRKIKEFWKKLDTAEKSCYTKTILSSPKDMRVEKLQTKRAQAGAFSESYAPNGGRYEKDEREGTTLLSDLEKNQIEIEDGRFNENLADGVDGSNLITENMKVRERGPRDVGMKSCRKTVPWNGRPSLGKTDLWSDSLSPERIGGKVAKLTKKQKKVQSILKPSGDASRQLKSKNRVSFGSLQNNIPTKTSSPENFGNNNTIPSDKDDNSAQLLHRTEEDMYDFERIARYDLCVEDDEDMYVTKFQQTSDITPDQNLSKSDNEHRPENETDFKIPKNVISKIKRKNEKNDEDSRNLGENILYPLTDISSQNSPADITTPAVKVKHTHTKSLITPQMNESLMQQKLEEVKKAPQKAKAFSPKASSRTEPVKKSTRRSISSETSTKSDIEKETSESESLSVTPLTESLPSGDESSVSQCLLGDMEESANVLCTKKRNVENVYSMKNPEQLLFEKNSLAECKCKATKSGNNFNAQPKRKRRGQHMEVEKQQDAYYTSSSSESVASLKEKRKKRHKMPQLRKKDQIIVKPPLFANKIERRSSKEQREIENRSPKPCKESKKVKSPVGRMDADRLISESPNKIDSIKTSPIGESCLYFNEDLSNESDNSSTVMDDRKQTNKVIMSAILRMQQAVQCQDTTDDESSSFSLPGIHESSSLTSEDDKFVVTHSREEEEEDEKEMEGNKLKISEETTDRNTQNFTSNYQTESSILSSSVDSQDVEHTHIQDQTIAQETRQSKIKEKDTQQIDKAQHAGKKLGSTGINSEQGCAGDEEKDVFKMFSKPSSTQGTNMQTRRFISSAMQESRSNFTDLFHEDDIFLD